MRSAEPSRVPAGVPTGGRFAASRHTDLGTDLLQAAGEPVAERELFDRFGASARHWGSRLGVDVEDLLQDTAVEFYATVARQRIAADQEPGLNGREVDLANRAPRVVNPGGWIHRIAYNIAARRVAGTDRSADLAALREFRARRDDAENRFGRGLSVAESDGLADEVRLSRPPRRRPAPGFHRRVRTVSTDVLEQDWDLPAEPEPAGGGEFAAHTAGAVAEGLLAGDGRSGRAKARGLAWDVVADVTGAPTVVPEILDPATASCAQGRVRDAGGAAAVARRWPGNAADPAVRALFIPFGQLDDAERDAIVRTVRRSGGYGDEVWAAALRAATARPARGGSPPR